MRIAGIPIDRRDGARVWLLYSGLAVLGMAVALLERVRPAEMPSWLPWDFSWPVFLTTFLVLIWYGRGLARTAAVDRPRPWRVALFLAGIISIYAVLQTHFDYAAQHMFFIHRFQHLVLHHLGPFLIALGCAGETLDRGMPAPLRGILRSGQARRFMNVVQHPFIAGVLFVGLIYFWLIPSVHLRAMLDVRVYNAMNWSMAIDGIWFWNLILDPRPKPPARMSFGMRIVTALAVMPPQILLGAYVTFTSRELYPVYALCGRILPMSAMDDQGYGGMILWIPGAMMSAVAIILTLNHLRIWDESGAARAD